MRCASPMNPSLPEPALLDGLGGSSPGRSRSLRKMPAVSRSRSLGASSIPSSDPTSSAAPIRTSWVPGRLGLGIADRHDVARLWKDPEGLLRRAGVAARGRRRGGCARCARRSRSAPPPPVSPPAGPGRPGSSCRTPGAGARRAAPPADPPPRRRRPRPARDPGGPAAPCGRRRYGGTAAHLSPASSGQNRGGWKPTAPLSPAATVSTPAESHTSRTGLDPSCGRSTWTAR